MKNKTKKVLSLFLSFLMVASIIPIGLLNVQALDGRVEKAIEWAISIANDNSHGYSQSNRNGPDYDCSSFVSTAFKNGGFSVSGSLTTRNMLNAFISVGFTKYNKGAVTLQRGDVLLKPGSHVELYIGNNQYVTAHSNYDGKTGDSNGKEILVHNKSYCNFSKNDEYTYILRYEGSSQNNGTLTNPYSSTNPDSYTYPSRTLKQTSPLMTGSDVAWVQAVLKKLGYNITIDGKYGPNTASTVKQFQSTYGLTVDGYCGPKTRAKLLELWNAMKHTHNYVWKRTVSATCTQTGKKVYQCSCGASYTETIAALGHSFPTQWIVDQVATCTQCGKEHRSCTRCGAIELATSPYKQHTASDWITDKNSTCTQKGTKHKECTSCGIVLETGTIAAMGHICSLFWIVDKPATCTQTGFKSHHCVKCSAKVDVTVIPKTSHKESEWITDANATVNAAGSKHKECTECGEVLETQTIPQLKPATPELTSATNGTSGVKVTWGAVEGADSYIVYRREYNASTKKWGSWSRLVSDETSTSYLDKTAKSGTYYRYTVRATNEAGNSGCNPSGIKTYFLSRPEITSTANNNSGITVKWGKVTGANGYVVYRKTTGGWTKVATVKGNSTVSYTDKTATAGVTYRYTIRAYYGSYLSSYVANGYAVRRLLTPTLKSVTSAKSGVTFKWNKVTGATGYIVYRKTGNGSWQQLSVVKGNGKITYLDKTAKKGVTYTYTVRAYYGTSRSYYNTKGLTIKDKY